MPLPAGVTTVPFHGQIASNTGAAGKGTVSFYMPFPLRDTVNNGVVGNNQPLTVTLDANGEFTVNLPATDDADITPTGWAYTIHINTDVWQDRFQFQVPAATVGTLELADVVEVVVPPTAALYALKDHIHTPASIGAVATTDPRLSDTRTPKSHAPSHATDGSDPITPAAIGLANAVQGASAELEGSAGAAIAAVTADNLALAVLPRSLTTPAAVLDLESPYELSGQYVHPDVYYNPAGWNGRKYWMAATPYARSNGAVENPVMLVSDDGLTWTYPAGTANQVLDPQPAGNALNSDTDILVVGGTMYLYYREHSSAPLYEKVMLRTSTDGVTWSAEQTVLDTTPDAPTSRLRLISPAVVHDGTQFVMYYSMTEGSPKRVMRRTSPDGVAWSAATAVISTGTAGLPFTTISHTDVYRDADGYWMVLQDEGNTATGPTAEGTRKVWLGTSADGITWAFDPHPVLTSAGFAQYMIYRTCLIRENRGGKDWLRLWVSGFAYAGDDTSAGSYIGYVEGFRPSQANDERRDLYTEGGIVARRHVRAREVGGDRLFGRFVAGMKARFDRILAYEAFFNQLRFRRAISGSETATDNREWRFRVDGSGGLIIEVFNPATSGWDLAFTIDAARKVIASQRFETPTVIATSTTGNNTFTNVRVEDLAVGANPNAGLTGVKVNLNTDNIRISSKRTPTGSADAALYSGCFSWDDNYIYVKTATGWKRAALATF